MVPALILQMWPEKLMRSYAGSAERASDPAASDLGVPSTSGYAGDPLEMLSDVSSVGKVVTCLWSVSCVLGPEG